MAMLRYTVFRQTADIDIIIDIRQKNVRSFIECFQNEYYIPLNSMSRAVGEQGMFNVIHTESAFKVDCVVRKQSQFQNSAFQRRERSDYFGQDIWIITCEDLILSKLLWSRDTSSATQFRDISNLLAANFDEGYVEEWIDVLNVRENYEKLLAEVRK